MATARPSAAGAVGPALRKALTRPSNPHHCRYARGGVDIVARLLSEPMKNTLNQTVIVENRTGASAMIAATPSRKRRRRLHDSRPRSARSRSPASVQGQDELRPARELTRWRWSHRAVRGVVAEGTPVHNPKELIAMQGNRASCRSRRRASASQQRGRTDEFMAGTMCCTCLSRLGAAVTDVATGAVTMSFSSLAARCR